MTAAAPTHRESRSVVAVAVLAVLAAASAPVWILVLSGDSGANFADTEVFDRNRLGAGTVDVEVGETTSSLGAEQLAPGDVVTGELELTNVGTFPVRVGVDASLEGDALADWLTFDFWLAAASCASEAPTPRNLLLGPAATSVIAIDAGSTGIAPDEAVRLCVEARLPLEAPNEVQDQAVGLDLTINAVHDLEAGP